MRRCSVSMRERASVRSPALTLAGLAHAPAQRRDRRVGGAEPAPQLEQVLLLRAADPAERLLDRDALAVGRSLLGRRRDAVLREPARQVLAGDLALRPPQRRGLGVAAPGQAARPA